MAAGKERAKREGPEALRWPRRIAFIGAGKVGCALAVSLARAGYPVRAVASRTFASAQDLARLVPGCRAYRSLQSAADRGDLVFITTPDGAIAPTAASLCWRPGQAVLHCSGALSRDALAAAAGMGAATGTFHPLQTFAALEEALENLPGTTFALEAEGPLLGLLQEMAAALDGRAIVLGPGDKALYHASSVLVSNYIVALASAAADLWQGWGISSEEALPALLPLLKGAVRNLERLGLPKALTGPISRGDVETVQSHLIAFQRSAPTYLSLYQELGRWTVPIGLAKGGLSEEQARAIACLLADGGYMDREGQARRMGR